MQFVLHQGTSSSTIQVQRVRSVYWCYELAIFFPHILNVETFFFLSI